MTFGQIEFENSAFSDVPKMYVKPATSDHYQDINDTNYQGPMLSIATDPHLNQHNKSDGSPHTYDRVYLTPAQVDDLITVLQYWRKEHTYVP